MLANQRQGELDRGRVVASPGAPVGRETTDGRFEIGTIVADRSNDSRCGLARDRVPGPRVHRPGERDEYAHDVRWVETDSPVAIDVGPTWHRSRSGRIQCDDRNATPFRSFRQGAVCGRRRGEAIEIGTPCPTRARPRAQGAFSIDDPEQDLCVFGGGRRGIVIEPL
jgi:hypothetical protein